MWKGPTSPDDGLSSTSTGDASSMYRSDGFRSRPLARGRDRPCTSCTVAGITGHICGSCMGYHKEPTTHPLFPSFVVFFDGSGDGDGESTCYEKINHVCKSTTSTARSLSLTHSTSHRSTRVLPGRASPMPLLVALMSCVAAVSMVAGFTCARLCRNMFPCCC